MAGDVHFHELIKISGKGKVDKIYSEMYILAESIAIHETQQADSELCIRKGEKNILKEDLRGLFEKKQERIEFHLGKMMKVLETIASNNSQKR